jgi:hypothetical protein
MRAQAVVQERRALWADWISRKSKRLAVLLGTAGETWNSCFMRLARR